MGTGAASAIRLAPVSIEIIVVGLVEASEVSPNELKQSSASSWGCPELGGPYEDASQVERERKEQAEAERCGRRLEIGDSEAFISGEGCPCNADSVS